MGIVVVVQQKITRRRQANWKTPRGVGDAKGYGQTFFHRSHNEIQDTRQEENTKKSDQKQEYEPKKLGQKAFSPEKTRLILLHKPPKTMYLPRSHGRKV
jgi:hypothetical protein